MFNIITFITLQPQIHLHFWQKQFMRIFSPYSSYSNEIFLAQVNAFHMLV